MFNRSAVGASAYSHPPGYSALRSFDDASAYGPDPHENTGQGWAPIIDELLRIRTLEDDWDGDGTDAPHPALVDGAITLAQSLRDAGAAPPDRVHAGVNATVYFEWHTPIGYCEVEVVSPVEAERRFVRRGSNTTEVAYLSRHS
jgi:hypothetical protein